MNKIVRTFEISNEQLSDLMVTALEGGINYWCSECSVMAPKDPKNGMKPVNMLPSDVVLKHDSWRLAFFEEDSCEYQYMDKKMLLEGVSKTMEWGKFHNVEDLIDNHDADTADVMIQFALFGKIVYG